jgi:hypothetical protein
VNVYASASAQATLNKMPRPAPLERRATTAPGKPHGKPFQGAEPEAAVSPYLNMYRGDGGSAVLPDYFTLVRPQLQQQEAARQQQLEMKKLRTQLQNLSATGGGAAPNSASMTAHAHYMDTAQFYRGTRR